MAAAIAPAVWTLAGLLALAGVAKLRDPAPTDRALRAIGMPGGWWIVRLLAVAELAVAAWCLFGSGSAAMAALAAAYMAFAGAISRMRQAGVADCGCFGERSFEPGAVHLALNMCAGAIAVAAVVVPPPDIGTLADRAPLEAVAIGAGVACCVYLAYCAFTLLPGLWGAYEETGGTG
jgi:uncharacterized membrane protein YphA (DoxX/SURF4 family)